MRKNATNMSIQDRHFYVRAVLAFCFFLFFIFQAKADEISVSSAKIYISGQAKLFIVQNSTNGVLHSFSEEDIVYINSSKITEKRNPILASKSQKQNTDKSLKINTKSKKEIPPPTSEIKPFKNNTTYTSSFAVQKNITVPNNTIPKIVFIVYEDFVKTSFRISSYKNKTVVSYNLYFSYLYPSFFSRPPPTV